MKLREITPADKDIWSVYRTLLWPDTDDNHLAEIESFFLGASRDIAQVFLAEDDRGEIAGFIELNIRGYAEGCKSSPVPYVEGWYIHTPYQGQGYGSALMGRAEQWARESGFTELASDAEVTNPRSIEVHKRLGFEEAERIVCFAKKL